ncbi:hypothetical protein [Wolbachia endosymbiont (group A) of Sphaerophoria taeniata]|uniref:hypothetical protein n=1 Tax=Wolbachia endosymbiont (group A) of Sphaerophoria taeniata TaxID=2954057 RepID=UPI002227F74D|nr:hypothetical protein [Wolbachia endosymbiont (group A) of Sphaerophoria taeniata]
MNPGLKAFLVVCGFILLLCGSILFLFFTYYYLSLLVNYILDPILVRPCKDLISNFYTYLSTSTSSPALAFLATGFIVIAAFICLNKMLLPLQEKIINNYNSFKNDNIDSNSKLFEVYKDPTIKLKDKILFFNIHLIYYLQLPFLYVASKVSALRGFLIFNFGLLLLNYALLIPVALLELIKYPLVRLFSPLGLNVKQLSFLFNVSDVGTSNQSVHTSSFEHSILQCAQELKQKFGAQPNVLDKEFEDYINGSDELTRDQKEQLKLYLNFNNSNRAAWQESRTSLTLTQAANLVLTAAKDQKSDIDFLKCMLLIRFKEGNGKCNLGMFNRIIYSLSCLEAKNNFTVEVNAQVYERMPTITEKFLRSCNNKKITVLKDNFDNFYSDGDMDPQIKSNISKLIEEAKQSVFNELYVDYYNRYGQDVGRGPIKHKLKELITSDDVKEAISAVIDGIEIPPVPPTYLERVKAFFGGHARSSAA